MIKVLPCTFLKYSHIYIYLHLTTLYSKISPIHRIGCLVRQTACIHDCFLLAIYSAVLANPHLVKAFTKYFMYDRGPSILCRWYPHTNSKSFHPMTSATLNTPFFVPFDPTRL